MFLENRGDLARRRYRAAGALGAALFASGPAQAQGAKLGALVPMTGPLAGFGPSSFNGINLAAKHVNAPGGVLGGELEIIVGDSQTNPQVAVTAARRLVSVDGVSEIIGALSSGVTIPVAQTISSVHGVPQISGSAAALRITVLADNDFLFRTTPHDAVQGIILANLAKESSFDRVAVMFRDDYYGKGLAASFEARYTAIGGTVTDMVPFAEEQASYRGELSRAAAGDPQALVQIAFSGEGVPMLKQALEEGFFSKFIFTDGMKSTDLIDAIGAKVLDGSIGTAPEAREDESARLFRAAYEAEHGDAPPLPFIDTFYDAAFILALAIGKAGSTDGTAVRGAIRAVSNPPGQPILPGEWAKARRLIADGADIDYIDAAGDVPGSFGIWTIADSEIKTLRIVDSE